MHDVRADDCWNWRCIWQMQYSREYRGYLCLGARVVLCARYATAAALMVSELSTVATIDIFFLHIDALAAICLLQVKKATCQPRTLQLNRSTTQRSKSSWVSW